MAEIRRMTSDPAAHEMLLHARSIGVETAFDRYELQQPQCGFGSLGLCCRICWKGPCRVDPFGAGPQKGICGADRHTIAARQIARMMAAGAAAHADHGRHVLHAMKKVADGSIKSFKITDEKKLFAVAQRMGIATSERAVLDVASDVAKASYEDFSNQDEHKASNWLTLLLPAKRIAKLQKLGVLPPNIDMGVAQIGRAHV